MSLFAPLLISFFFFSGFAVAGIYAPGCTLANWTWSLNSLGQSPCTVAAFMMSTCNGGSFTLQQLPSGYHYTGPSSIQGTNACLCNTVSYSLLSACEGCRGSDWITWPVYVTNCSATLPPGSFPNSVPAGTSVQRWALLDITIENTWDQANAMAIGDGPELGPGTILGPAGPSSSITTASAGSPSNTTGPVKDIPERHSSNTGAIAGGAIGGVVVIFAFVIALLFYRKSRRSQARSVFSGNRQASAHYPTLIQYQPVSGQETLTSTLPETPNPLLRPYNTEGRTIFPGYLAPPNRSFTSTQPPPSLSNTRNLYTVASPQNPEAQGI